ncbi:MAG TPA: hypothetical protein VK835_10490 [Bacteroidia bacterium]|jgi:hypothetical protein|nr:hypothetical protein [Bacteroidia bacterium]
MNKLKIVIFSCLCAFLLAYTPEKIHRITRQSHEFSFYKEQIPLWKKETIKKPKDAAAWENYYLALRYANMLDPDGKQEDRVTAMHDAVTKMEENIPATVEFYHCKVMDLNSTAGASKQGDKIISYIEKGLAINPLDDALLEDMIVRCELDGKTDKLKEYYTKLYNSHVNTYTVMEYNYNVLMSVEPNAIVFTHGDNDSYPVWMLQQVKGLREDVSIINMGLATIPAYLKRMLLQKNIELPDAILNMETQNEEEFIKRIVLEINKKYPTVPVFFALTCGVQGVFEDSLYCTGLAYKFSSLHMDNIKALQNNIENKFHIDYLSTNLLPNDSLNQDPDNLNANYTVPFAMLYQHYKNNGQNNERMNFYRAHCLLYAAKKGKEAEMKAYLDGK